MSNKIKIYLFLNISFFIYSISGLIAKLNASYSETFSMQFLIMFGLQLFVMGIYTIMWQFSLKKIELSDAYAFKGVVIIWGLLFSKLIFDEVITLTNIVGAIIIITGIWVMINE